MSMMILLSLLLVVSPLMRSSLAITIFAIFALSSTQSASRHDIKNSNCIHNAITWASRILIALRIVSMIMQWRTFEVEMADIIQIIILICIYKLHGDNYTSAQILMRTILSNAILIRGTKAFIQLVEKSEWCNKIMASKFLLTTILTRMGASKLINNDGFAAKPKSIIQSIALLAISIFAVDFAIFHTFMNFWDLLLCHGFIYLAVFLHSASSMIVDHADFAQTLEFSHLHHQMHVVMLALAFLSARS